MTWLSLPSLNAAFSACAGYSFAQTTAQENADTTHAAQDHLTLDPPETLSLEAKIRKIKTLIDRYEMRRALDGICNLLSAHEIDAPLYDAIQTLARDAILNLVQSGYHAEAREFSHRIILPAAPHQDIALTLAV